MRDANEIARQIASLPDQPDNPAVMFPLGRPLAVLMLVSVASGFAVLLRSASRQADLVVWVFDQNHARTYRDATEYKPSLVDQFFQLTGQRVEVQTIASRALDIRLMSVFQNRTSENVPDLVEVEIGSVGKFFRPDTRDIGFLPLNKFLDRSGSRERLLPSRVSIWAKGGKIFGVPLDVHPVGLIYRKDLYDSAGVDLEAVHSWAEFEQAAKRFQQFWRDAGQPRLAMGWSSTSSDSLTMLLLQQQVNLIDANLQTHLTDPIVCQTLAWYARSVANIGGFAGDISPGPGQVARDLTDGRIAAVLAPDWQIATLHAMGGSSLSGKLRMVPLPRFSDSDSPTSTWGGTMIGIPRNCRDPEASWRLLQQLCLSSDARLAQSRFAGTLPAIPAAWLDPVWHQGDALFAGQKIDELFIKLSADLPDRTVTPYDTLAQTFLAIALNRSVRELNRSQMSSTDFASRCTELLRDADVSLQRAIAFDRESQ